MVEANESGMSQWLGGKEKEERKEGLIGMEARKGARGKSPTPSFAMRFPCSFRYHDVPQVSEPSP